MWPFVRNGGLFYTVLNVISCALLMASNQDCWNSWIKIASTLQVLSWEVASTCQVQLKTEECSFVVLKYLSLSVDWNWFPLSMLYMLGWEEQFFFPPRLCSSKSTDKTAVGLQNGAILAPCLMYSGWISPLTFLICYRRDWCIETNRHWAAKSQYWFISGVGKFWACISNMSAHWRH
jgi:hypothetical protein